MTPENQTMDCTVLRPRLPQDMTVILILMNEDSSQRRPRLITRKRGPFRAGHVVEIKRQYPFKPIRCQRLKAKNSNSNESPAALPITLGGSYRPGCKTSKSAAAHTDFDWLNSRNEGEFMRASENGPIHTTQIDSIANLESKMILF
jgi:hypothetical protein